MTDKMIRSLLLGIKTKIEDDISREQIVAKCSEEEFVRVIRMDVLKKIIDDAMNMEDEDGNIS